LNVRDLGGLPLVSGGRTRFGEIARSEAPVFLTDRGWDELRRHGVRTLVDLRCPTECDYEARDGVRRVAVPIFRADDSEFNDRVAGVPDTGAFYRVLVAYCHRTIAAAVGAVADAPAGGVVIHCHSGRDRTGIVAALLLELAGVGDETIADDYVATRSALQPRHEDELAAAASPDEREWLQRIHDVRPEFVLSALELVRTSHGSVREYLLRGGLTTAQLERVRARLVE